MKIDVVKSVFARWGHPIPKEDFGKREKGELLGITVGLGALFGESLTAERAWMNTENEELGGKPIDFVLAGQTTAVLEQVNKERGL